MGETTVMTGTLQEKYTKRVRFPKDPRWYTVLAARIVNADQEVVVDNDNYTFELAAPDNTAGNTPAGTGLNAVRALRASAAAAADEKAAAGPAGSGRRKTKKSKYRSRKTRRRHR